MSTQHDLRPLGPNLPRSSDHSAWRGALGWGLLLLVLIVDVGCRSEELPTTYGRRRGTGAASIAGTSVLSKMFEQAGHDVRSWRRLSPKLSSQDVIVWIPDRFLPPTSEETAYLDNWLSSDSNRTLIYVGRDYDAEADYWDQVLPQVAARERIEIRQRMARSRAQHITRRALTDEVECEWFTWSEVGDPEWLASVEGTWTESLGPEPTRLWLDLAPSLPEVDPEDEWYSWSDAESLLADGDRVLAGRLRHVNWEGSQVIVVANGSFLLNLPLVDRQNRRLAETLIESCGRNKQVCFLEGGDMPLRISETDNELPLVLRLFTLWPINLLMIQLVLVGILYCFYVLPIFGRPRTLPPDPLSDFGKHVSAVGELLERGKNESYARDLIDDFHSTSKSRTVTNPTDT